MTDVGSEHRPNIKGVVLFAVVLILVGWDLAGDYGQNVGAVHLTVEVITLILAAVGTGYLGREYAAVKKEARTLNRDLSKARADGTRWRTEAHQILKGLGEAIALQLERWKLTPAEAEIAVLLLKGLSHKEIAQVRDTSERTVRQQAQSLYLKAGISGRSELCAFFLEDLLPPREELLHDTHLSHSGTR